MATVIFIPDPVEWPRMTTSNTGLVGEDARKRAETARMYAMKQVGKRTGHLAASIHVLTQSGSNGPSATVGSDDRIALLHHNGTRPHIELAAHGHLLRFSIRGRVVYARKVVNPGTKPNRYLTDNLRRVVR